MLRGKSVLLAVALLAFGLAAGTGCSKDEGLKITSIEPREGPFGGGDPVTIYGSGFQSGGTKSADVYFGKNKATVLEFEGDDKMIVSPPGGKPDETVKITIIFGDSRKIEIEDAYKYIDPAPLDVGDLTDKEKKAREGK
jgi:hypothetical protein